MKQFQYLMEITVPQIKQNNNTGFPNTKKRQNVAHLVDIRHVKFEPYVPSNKLIVIAEAFSNGNVYQPMIEFNDVEFTDSGVSNFKGTDGEEHSINKIMLSRADVSINCTCSDFKFRFAHQHYQNKSLVGEPPEQYVKVPGSNRPPVNPDNVLGACKHILALEQHLKRLGIIV